MGIQLKPKKGGFLRPFGCGWFIREYLLGNMPYGSPMIGPRIGAPQAEICREYKLALIREWGMDRAVRLEERLARMQERPISPDEIEDLFQRSFAEIPYKTTACRLSGLAGWSARGKKNLQPSRTITLKGNRESSIG